MDIRQVGQTGGQSSPPKLVKAARQFESILLQSWLEKMNKINGNDRREDAAHDTISSLGAEAAASALAQRGGIGIARMILGHFRPHSKDSNAPE
jgi:Rod binding domain-containing protein